MKELNLIQKKIINNNWNYQKMKKLRNIKKMWTL